MKTIYNLKLHEEFQADGYLVVRVPGGWIYRFWDYKKKDYYPNATFVPYSEEYLSRNPDYIGFAEDNPTHVGVKDNYDK